jgi:hypothetical protein
VADGDVWLDSTYVLKVLGDDLAEPTDSTSLEEYVAGVREYVEGKRRDLWTTADPDADPPVVSTFAATSSVKLGAAMLTFRFYSRRTSPLGVIGFTEDGAAGMLREDPDIAKLLGIGRHGKFVFGAGPDLVVADVVEETA